MTIQIVKSGKPILFDSEDWSLVHPYKWYVDFMGYAVSAPRKKTGQVKTLKMHRLILGMSDPKEFTDHINHIKTDNRRINIRRCTPAENGRNRTPKARYLGVTYQNIAYTSPKTGQIFKYKYLKAKIRVNNRLIHLGTFTNERDAAIAYNEAAKLHFGEFANLNVID